jgi:CRISPR-associated protein Csb1
MQPAGGEGAKVFPPTYSGGVYAVEQRRLPGRSEPVTCVLLDSVQSQANRMELALQQAMDEERIHLPLIEVDFSEANKELIKPIDDRITSLTVPHRLADAILRDSVVTEEGDDKGKWFRDSSFAEKWRKASPSNATPIFELCPTALLFGVWGAPEKPGGLGAKFQRCITSEIVGIEAELLSEHRQGLRRDPLGIVRGAEVEVLGDERWKNAQSSNKKTKRPSEINHGPILFGPSHGGTTFVEADQTTVLTLAGVRWLRFPPTDDSGISAEQQRTRDQAGRMVLSSLGLCASVLAQEMGLDLRSGCLLHPVEMPQWELVDQPGSNGIAFGITGEQAIELLNQSIGKAEDAGLSWRDEPLRLKPSEELVELVRRSQEQAAKEEEGAE